MKKYGQRIAPIISLEGARVRRAVQRADSHMKPKEDLCWVCRCGCWQYEVKPNGVFCVGCGNRQLITITTKLERDPHDA